MPVVRQSPVPSDLEIAQAAELRPITEVATELGLLEEEIDLYGRYKAKIALGALERMKGRPDGKLIDVTAITPTPLGEGKTVTSIGLAQALRVLGKSICLTLREPSMGPVFGIKGGAAGGGYAQVVPMEDLNLHFTGDIHAVSAAHNLLSAMLDASLAHGNPLNIDPFSISWRRVVDLNDGALRSIILGLGGKRNGLPRESGYDIAVSSEVMAILAVCSDLADLRKRLGNIIVAYSRKGEPVTTEDLECAGAMTAWMREAINPNLLQSLEGQPCFVHAGPFANIAIGQSSVVADRICLKLADYHVTESGFGADIGFEKFWNVKCRISGHTPNVSVITATVRALKHHGVKAGALPCPPGKPIPKEYNEKNMAWLEDGVGNLLHHIETVKKSGINPVVCINRFHTDTGEEVNFIKKAAEKAGARAATSQHWLKGGDGALEFADAVVDACKDKPKFKFLYDLSMPLRQRVDLIAREVYGADGASFSPLAEEKAKKFESDPKYNDFYTMMVKTHLSLSHDPTKKGTPKGWVLPVRDFLVYGGAKFICPVAGDISLMPATSSDPAFRRVDVDVTTGKVKGLF